MAFCEVLESVFGFIASATTIIGMVPQVWKAYKTRSVEDISMVMLVNYIVCSVAWMVYGILTGAAFVFWSNVFSTIVAVISIYQKSCYDRGEKSHAKKGL